jgi:hypothetical protein
MKRGKFTQRWVNSLLATIDEHLDVDTRVRLMESCGRACARLAAIETAERCRDDLPKFVSSFRSWVGKDNVRYEDGEIHLVYPTCLCQLQAEVPETLAETYCYCSCGWLKEMFETVFAEWQGVEHPKERL